MGKKQIMIVGGIVIAVLAILAVVMTSKKDSTTSNNESQTQAETAPEGETTVEGSLFSVAEGGKAQTCDMSYEGSEGVSNGKLYTDGKGRGRIQLEIVTDQGNKGESNTLVTGDKVYSWTKTDGGSFGFVFEAKDVKTNSSSSSSTSSSPSAGQNFSMKCKSWNVDEAVLTIPTDVNFTGLPTAQ